MEEQNSWITPNQYMQEQDDAAMIQAAVNAAAGTGVPVWIPAFNERTQKAIWTIPRAIELPEGCTVMLCGCHLRLADGVFCNIFKNSVGRSESAAKLENRQSHIRICGIGRAVLDGGNHNGLTERTEHTLGFPGIIENTLLHFHNASQIVVENLELCNPRWWGMTFHCCDDCRISNIRIEADNSAPNPLSTPMAFNSK